MLIRNHARVQISSVALTWINSRVWCYFWVGLVMNVKWMAVSIGVMCGKIFGLKFVSIPSFSFLSLPPSFPSFDPSLFLSPLPSFLPFFLFLTKYVKNNILLLWLRLLFHFHMMGHFVNSWDKEKKVTVQIQTTWV